MKSYMLPVLSNSWVLYFVVFVVFFNLVGHALYGNFLVALIFILIGFITSFFSKNMIVILVIGITVSNILFYGPRKVQLEGMASKEGMVDMNEDMEEDDNKLPNNDRVVGKIPTVTNPVDINKKLQEVKEVKDRLKSVKDAIPTTRAGTNMNSQQVDFMKDKYGELLKLQDEILNNIGNLEKSVDKIDQMINDVKTNVDGIRSTIPTTRAGGN